MTNENPSVQNILEALEKEFPDKSERVASVAFVNWFNILNHCSLEGLNPKQVLFIASIIVKLASDNYEASSNQGEEEEDMQEISFEDAIRFLNEEHP